MVRYLWAPGNPAPLVLFLLDRKEPTMSDTEGVPQVTDEAMIEIAACLHALNRMIDPRVTNEQRSTWATELFSRASSLEAHFETVAMEARK